MPTSTSLCANPAGCPWSSGFWTIKPGKWTPEIVVSRHNALFRNVKDEVQYAQLVHVLGSERAKSLLNFIPACRC